MVWPVRGPVTSPFCERRAWEACHPGIDIAVPSGTADPRRRARARLARPGRRRVGRLRQLHLPAAHRRRLHVLRPPGADPRAARAARRPRPADRDLRLHRPLLRPAPALRGPPRRPARLPGPLPRRAPPARCARPAPQAHEQPADQTAGRDRAARRSALAGCHGPLPAASAADALAGRQLPLPAMRSDRDRARPPCRAVPATQRRAPGRRPGVRLGVDQLGLAHARRPSAHTRSPRRGAPGRRAARQRAGQRRRRQPRARPARAHAAASSRSTCSAEPGRVSAIVVTREQTYTAGHADLGGQHHRVYHALLSRGAHGWKVTAWTPLP